MERMNFLETLPYELFSSQLFMSPSETRQRGFEPVYCHMQLVALSPEKDLLLSKFLIHLTNLFVEDNILKYCHK